MFALSAALVWAMLWADPPRGCQIGAEVPQFYVREVTSTRPNVATCFVCRYGRRPVVMLCVREFDEQVEQLLVDVDRVVDGHRGQGLRGFAFFMPAEQAETQGKLMSFARRRQLSLPLTFPIEEGGPRTLEIPEDVHVAVLCYSDHKIVSRALLKRGEATAERIREVTTAAAKLAE